MTLIVRGLFWFGLYVFLVTFPLLAAVLAAPRGGSSSFLANVGVGAGYLALAMMALEMALVARVRAAPGVPPVPHETGGAYASCRGCHSAGGAAAPLPATHRSFRDGTCLTCHRAAG